MKHLFINIKKNKYKYIFLLTIVVLGIISGIILSSIISYNDKKEINESITNYLLNNKNNYLKDFINIFKINIFYLLFIFIFSLSILGIILNPIILYIKSLIIGFNLGIMVTIYKYKGIIIGILSIFPHQIINLIIYLILSFYGILISNYLFKSFFLKKNINLSIYFKKYLKITLFSFIIIVFSTIYEIFLGNFFINLFTFLIK